MDWGKDFVDWWWWWIFMAPEGQEKERLNELTSKILPNFLEKLTNRLEQNAAKYKGSKFIATDKMTIADIDLCATVYCYLLNEDNLFYKESKKVVESFPEAHAYFLFLKEQLHDYFAERPRYPF
mmetsp:Transcript_22996/g.17439  ORF Transcript_22996/g.17439 Transcript_22996/m.17439 type:complete len:124 (+) Transcript_22996:812-1183(+)